MFVFTFRKGGLRRLAAVCLCGAAIVGAAAAGIAWNRAQSTPANAALTQQITGSQDIASFLAGYGLEVDPTSAEVMAVKVPRKWDESFEAFHAVVQQSGLTLEKCKGKQVDKWTVPVPALCDDTKKTYAVVLVYKNEPQGAYLLEKPSGEVKALVPAQSSAALTQQEKEAAAGVPDAVMMEPIIGMENPWRYRNKAQYPIGTGKDGLPAAGFFAGRTHTLIPIPNQDCLLGCEENREILNIVLQYMRDNGVSPYHEETHQGLVRHVLIRKGFTSGQLLVCMVINGRSLPHGERLG